MRRDMLEATRLTRAGRLKEATQFIQRQLRGGMTAPVPERTQVEPMKALGAQSFKEEKIGEAQEAGPRPNSNGSQRGSRSGIRGFLDRIAAQVRGVVHLDDPIARGEHVGDGTDSTGTFVWRQFTSAVGTRQYKLYVPSDHVGEPLPLVVMLHGCSQDPDDFAAGTRMNALAEKYRCLVVYPAQPSSANAGKCWNWFNPADQRHGAGEPALIAGITREVMRDHAVDRRRVFVAGLSAGGAAAAIMGMTYPDLYAAIGVHSGLACGAAKDVSTAVAAMQSGASVMTKNSDAGNLKPDRLVPAIVFHGNSDRQVNPRNGDDVVRQFQEFAHMDLRPLTEQGEAPGGRRYSRTLYVDATGKVMIEHWAVHGLGHAWSGGSTDGTYTDPSGPDAADAMLRFFFEHAVDGV